MNATRPDQIDFNFNKANLFREESVTDLNVGSIRCLKPIKLDGTDDPARMTIYVGHAQLRTSKGLVPIQTRLKATTLRNALEEFPGAMQQVLEEMVEKMKRMQEQQKTSQTQNESPIIAPGR